LGRRSFEVLAECGQGVTDLYRKQRLFLSDKQKLLFEYQPEGEGYLGNGTR
jgi:hypothetical protein